MTIFSREDDKKNEVHEEKHSFLLNIDIALWEDFLKTIPPYHTATSAITQMIRERVEALRKEWGETNAREK